MKAVYLKLPTGIFFPKLIFKHFALQLPSSISDGEISKLADLFKANTLETVALQFLGATEVQIDNYRMNNIENVEKFKRELLYGFRNKANNRKVNFFLLWEGNTI